MATTRLCSVPDCGKRAHAGGYCSNHYYRWKQHGDPLGGRVPNGAAIAWIERHISHKGDDCLIWPFRLLPNGYPAVYYDGSITTATRIMCLKAHGPAPDGKPLALHSCGRGHMGCINPNHLEWGDHFKNQGPDRLRDSTSNRGRANGGARLTEAIVRHIRISSGRHQDIADRIGVARQTVSDIKSGRAWAWLK